MSIPPAAIDRTSAVPLHDQFRSYLLERIAQGELQPGERLPGEREYAAALGISLAPIRQALLNLVKDGYLTRARGRGTFVEQEPVDRKVDILSSFTESMRATGLRPEVRVLFHGVAPAPKEARTSLHTTERELILVRRVAILDAIPVTLLTAYLSPRTFPDLALEPLRDGSLYRTLRERYDVVPSRAISTIEVIRCQSEAADLGVARGTPAMRVQSTTFDGAGRPFEFSQLVYRAERFRLSLESYRQRDQVVHLLSDSSPLPRLRGKASESQDPLPRLRGRAREGASG